MLLAAGTVCVLTAANWWVEPCSKALARSCMQDDRAVKKGQPTSTEIKKLIAQLGALEYKVREKATKELADIGLPVLEALQDAEEHPDLETRQRVNILVKRIRDTNKLPTRVNGLEFKVVLSTNKWAIPTPGKETKIDIALVVKNTKREPAHVLLYGAISAVLADKTGKKLESFGGRQASTPGKDNVPVLAKNESYAFELLGGLSWRDGSLEFEYIDRFTCWETYERLSKGTYRISIKYGNDLVSYRGKGPLWLGTVETLPEIVTIE